MEEKILALGRKITIETEKSALKLGEAHGKVSIVLGTDDATNVDLNLTYSTPALSPS